MNGAEKWDISTKEEEKNWLFFAVLSIVFFPNEDLHFSEHKQVETIELDEKC